MAWTIDDRFPQWGEDGEFPAAGFFYEGGDQINEKHQDALWNGIKELENDIQAALSDIDSDGDGVVDEADTANSADHNDLTNVQTDQHHSKTASSEIAHDDTQGGTDSDAHHTRYSDSEASAAAPVQSVNDETGDVSINVDVPLYGDGSDGEVIRSANGSENGILYTTRYELQSGVTRTVDNGVTVIHATDEIVIDGTLDASGHGTVGGTGGSGGAQVSSGDGNGGSPGSTSSQADINGSDTGSGGSGGDSGGVAENGGSGGGGTGLASGGGGAGGGGADDFSTGSAIGGDGASGADPTSHTFTDTEVRMLRQVLTKSYDTIYDLTVLGGSGGAGGGGGGSGGEAGGGSGGAGGDGGNGGNGGGVIVLFAPEIRGSGLLDASAEDGDNGQDGSNGGGAQGGGGGGAGGGGGGNGGCVITLNNIGPVSTDVSGGSGGNGGEGGAGSDDAGGSAGNGGIGGDGAAGVNGLYIDIST